MRFSHHGGRREPQAGIALLISIFVLLLVCIAGIAMVVASGTESALTGNYQSSTAVYYAAIAGLEEGRGRLLVQNPNFVNNAVPNFIPPPGNTLPLGKVLYILNGSGVNPLDSADPASFPDLEYDLEFGSGSLANANGAGTVFNTSSVSAVAGLPGPLYKWVRINAVTESAINLDVDNSGGPLNTATPLYYDGAHLNLTSTGAQALEVTALAAYPNGSQKMLQYITAAPATSLNFNLPAAVVLSGNNVQFTGPNYSAFVTSGYDTQSVGACNPATPGVSAVGYTNNTDSSYSNITAPGSNVMNYQSQYSGVDAARPDIKWVGSSLPSNLQTISGLNALVQTVTQNADAVVSNPPSPTNLSTIVPAGMSASNPAIVVVNGDLTLDSTNFTGYGILLVTGKFVYNPATTWNGLVLVIGKGEMANNGWNTGQINGGVLLAKTLDDSGNPLSVLGAANFQFGAPATASLGVRYSSCWINAAQLRLVYKVLSFREIPQ
jgi:hypothetical protein